MEGGRGLNGAYLSADFMAGIRLIRGYDGVARYGCFGRGYCENLGLSAIGVFGVVLFLTSP